MKEHTFSSIRKLHFAVRSIRLPYIFAGKSTRFVWFPTAYGRDLFFLPRFVFSICAFPAPRRYSFPFSRCLRTGICFYFFVYLCRDDLCTAHGRRHFFFVILFTHTGHVSIKIWSKAFTQTEFRIGTTINRHPVYLVRGFVRWCGRNKGKWNTILL